jgi:hypothetical protein
LVRVPCLWGGESYCITYSTKELNHRISRRLNGDPVRSSSAAATPERALMRFLAQEHPNAIKETEEMDCWGGRDAN